MAEDLLDKIANRLLKDFPHTVPGDSWWTRLEIVFRADPRSTDRWQSWLEDRVGSLSAAQAKLMAQSIFILRFDRTLLLAALASRPEGEVLSALAKAVLAVPFESWDNETLAAAGVLLVNSQLGSRSRDLLTERLQLCRQWPLDQRLGYARRITSALARQGEQCELGACLVAVQLLGEGAA